MKNKKTIFPDEPVVEYRSSNTQQKSEIEEALDKLGSSFKIKSRHIIARRDGIFFEISPKEGEELAIKMVDAPFMDYGRKINLIYVNSNGMTFSLGDHNPTLYNIGFRPDEKKK